MKQKITEKPQQIVVYKINPNQQELNREVYSDRNVDGRILAGNYYIYENTLIVEDNNNKVTGVFSLNHYYFLESDNT